MSNERGQSAVEFALVLPVLLAVVMGILAFGNYYGKYQSLTAAVRVAGRQASICDSLTSTDPTPQQAGVNAASGVPSPVFTFTPAGESAQSFNSNPCDSSGGGPVPSGTTITVQGTGSAQVLSFFGYSLSIGLTSTMKVVEQ